MDSKRLLVSAKSGAGLGELAAVVTRRLAPETSGGEGGLARLLCARHRSALERSGRALEEVLALLAGEAPLDLVAEGLRASLQALDELSGRTTPEDVLDGVFSRFCLGK